MRTTPSSPSPLPSPEPTPSDPAGVPVALRARLEAAADSPATVTFVAGDPTGDGYRLQTATRSELHDDARRLGATLGALGARPGAPVALIGPTSRALATAIEATWLVGATVVVLPLPMRLGSIEAFVSQTRARVRHAGAAVVIVDDALAELFTPVPGDPPARRLGAVLADAAGRRPDHCPTPRPDPERLAVLQYTSGSTADPKGVMIPERCLLANLDAMAERAVLEPRADRVVSWLPLYHDMGLVGLFGGALLTGTDLVLAGPQDFLAAPARWLSWMSELGGTITAGPNFAYALATRALRRAGPLDLRRWRIALNGAEPIDPDTFAAFLDAAAPAGMDPAAAFCAYGMAEATLGVTFPDPGTGMAVDAVRRPVLERDRYAAPADPTEPATRRLPRLGRPLAGLEVRVVDPATGQWRRDREVGEVELRGTSVTPGYLRDPATTAATIRDGWLRTGDLGYRVDGELVLCGRLKDVIIIGGRNIYPEDVERAVAGVDGIRAGNVIAFGTAGRRGREAVVVVAETRHDDPSDLHDAVVRRVVDAVGVPPAEVVFVRPGTLPKTSSGKLQRSLCRSRYEQSVLEAVR